MKRLLLLFTAVLAFGAIAVTPAGAVKFGTPDTNNTYEWVGLMVAIDDEGEPMWRCTGSLIQPDTFLTAGHCVSDGPDAQENPAVAYIWFDPTVITTDPQYLANLAYEDEHGDDSINLCTGELAEGAEPSDEVGPVEGYPCGGYDAYGTPLSHENWSGSLTIPQTSDVGLVTDVSFVPNAEYVPDTYGQLAPVGYLDNLAITQGKGNVEFTVVGYGLQSVRPVESAIKQRMIGTVSLVNLKSALVRNGEGTWNLHYSNNPGLGHGGSGGTCFGDSGGPVIYDDPVLGEIIVAVNSFVLNSNCNGAGFGYRVDTAYAQAFINAND